MGQRITQMEEAGGSVTADESIEVAKLSATVTITAATISALASDQSFNDSGGGFVTAGFLANRSVQVTGFTGDVANNIYTGVLTAVTANKLTIGGADGDVIVDDAAGESVTITQWETKRRSASSLGGGTELQSHEFTVSGDGPYTISASSSGDYEALYLDGIRMPSANFTVVGDQLTLVGLTSALYERGVIDFSPA